MKVSMAYKYKLFVSKKQKELLFNHIFAHNQTWNILLNESIKQFDSNKLRIEQNLDPIYLSEVQQDSLVKQVLKARNLHFNVQVIQQTRILFNSSLKKTIKNFKSKKSDTGMLKFKDSKNFNNQGFSTTKNQYSILDSSNPKFKILRLFRQNFKIRWTRDFPINSKLSNVNFTFKDNAFYVSFNISYESNRMITDIHSTNGIGLHDNLLTECNKQSIACKKKISNDIKSIGMDINIDSIDLGNKLIHKVFNIKDIKFNNLIYKNEKKIKRLQRKQSRRVELSTQSEQAFYQNATSNPLLVKKLVRCNPIPFVEWISAKKSKSKLGKNFYKTQLKINKISTKNSNIKVFKLHKIVNEILYFMKENNYNHIVMEDLDVKQMTSKDNINLLTECNKQSIACKKIIGKKKSKTMKKNILQISFSMFKQILTYKCAINGVYVSLVDPKNTSKSCSKCGNIDDQLNIIKRVYECKECDLKIKRDHNSCINMINKFYL